MTLSRAFIPAMLAAVLSACFHDSQMRERELTKSFKVATGSVVVVDVSGGNVRVSSGEPGVVNLSLKQEVWARSDRDADEQIGRYDVALTQDRDTVTLKARRRTENDWGWHGVNLSARVEVPPNVRLDVRTAGGQVTVGGERAASMKLRTSGGSVRVDGGPADMDIATQGGRIDILRALGAVTVRTSGGNIDIHYLTVERDVDLTSSGGNIDVSVAPTAAFTFDGRSTGGNINIRDLARASASPESKGGDTELNVAINGGGTRRLTARSTGGNIKLKAADADN